MISRPDSPPSSRNTTLQQPAAPNSLDACFLVFALVMAAVIPAVGIPVYFRTDDVYWLGWALEHPNPVAALVPQENLFGYYRPVPTLVWWVMARLFGFEPLGYQLVLAGAMVLGMVPLFRIGRRLTGEAWGGFMAVGFYHALNVTVLYYVFWYSALTFGLELLLLLLAFDALTNGSTTPGRPAAFVVWGLLAGLAKEPAVVILPVVAGGLILMGPRTRRGKWTWLMGLAAVSMTMLYLTPFVASRSTALSVMTMKDWAASVSERFDFYAHVLLRGPAGPIAALSAVIALMDDARQQKWIPIVIGGVSAVAVTALPIRIAAPVWVVLLVAAAIRVPMTLPWVGGFLISATLLLNVYMHVATYLLEPLLCLVPATFLWARPAWQPVGRFIGVQMMRMPHWVVVVAPIVALFVLAATVREYLPPIVAMRQVRSVFRSGVETLITRAPHAATVGCVSYDELGTTYSDIRRSTIGRRVELHKTMDAAQLEKFLHLRGRSDLKVVSLLAARAASGPVCILALSEKEEEAVRHTLDAKPLARFVEGHALATVYLVPNVGGSESDPP